VIRKSIPELHIGNIIIRRKSNSVKIGESEVALSKPEFELLFFFAQNPDKVISHENLLRNIWVRKYTCLTHQSRYISRT
jgi:DNA-binding response OmpR family regulator